MRGEDVNGNVGPNGYNTVQYYTTYNKTKQLLKIFFSFDLKYYYYENMFLFRLLEIGCIMALLLF